MAILSSHNRFSVFFFTGRFFGNFAVSWLLKIPLFLAYVAALSCETLLAITSG